MKLIVRILRIIVGIVFIFSGLVKANDPLGLSYKMEEFMQVLHLNFLTSIVLPLSIIMIAFEILAGIALLLGFYMRIFATLLLLLIIFFTFLTGYAFLSGKVHECGCFGDCIKISNSATFWKDVALLIMILIIFFYRKKIRPAFKKILNGILMLIGVIIAFGLQWYVLNHLPIVDCLPYAVGKNIPQQMKIPPNAIPDKYETMMVYEKNGVQKEFTMDNYPWQDTTWKFVSRRDKLIQKGNAIPAIQDFSITDYDGNDSTQSILHHQGYLYLFLVKDINEAGSGWDKKMQALQQACTKNGIPIYGVTASDERLMHHFKAQHNLQFPFLQMDATVIKTIGRSNPCLLLLDNGTVKGKWHYHDIPD